MDKKVYLCNRVVRCSKAQHTSEFALSLNRYHKIETLLFYSDTQLDTVFLTILHKDTQNRWGGEKKKTKNACNFTCMRFFVLFYKAGCVLLYDDFIRK